jgi:hypothetical protein
MAGARRQAQSAGNDVAGVRINLGGVLRQFL